MIYGATFHFTELAYGVFEYLVALLGQILITLLAFIDLFEAGDCDQVFYQLI